LQAQVLYFGDDKIRQKQKLFATETASFTAVGFCGKIKQVLEEHKLNANKKLSK